MSEQKLREYLKRVTSDLHRARLRVKELEEQRPEPVAIIGMACRFPGGATSPGQLWDLVARGGDAVADFPADRGWDVGELLELGVAPVGGFLPMASEFDAQFFGISPREALAMDPQQRLALECSWEALENSGVDPTDLRGSDAGIFMGTNGQDYSVNLTASADADDVVGHVATGNAASVLSGRVAYVLGLEGPSVSVDTACSSSLVALHWAAQALRRGECTLAMAGGVTVMSTVGAFAEFAHQGGLAADGRCKAFSDDADGTGWGEGIGVLVMERLADAERLGHRVLAIMRGSAVNSDGASSSLTAPNGPSQQRVIRRALADAGLSPAEVDAVEAHGTGTRLGDPIEAQALLATYGRDRDRPLWLGSVKSNIGHTQAAAGVAGVIKMVEAMRHGVLPQTLHATAPSSQVDWDAGAVEILTEARPWDTKGPRRAAVSSFGISGTNAHVILEQGPEPLAAADDDGDLVVPWLISAHDGGALTAQAEQLKDVPGSATDIGWSLATTRAALGQRAMVVGADRDELMAGLDSLTVRGQAGGDGRVGVVFSGQGSQRVGMGEGLRSRFPVFAETFDEICGRFDIPVADAMRTGESLDETRFTQVALFAYEVAVFRLLESWGVRADVLLGHSIGEVAAAYVAGVWSLDDACALVGARGRLMQALPEGGAMVSVEAAEDEVEPLLTDGVSIAAVNAPRAVVISGVEGEVDAVADRLDGRRAKRLSVSRAFHSPLMEPMLEEFREVAERLTYREPSIPIISNLTGEPVTGELTDPGYWVRHVREAVRFADGVQAMAGCGVDAVVEIAPKSVLSSAVREATDVVVAPLAREKLSSDRAALTGLGHLWVNGVEVDWTAVFEGTAPRKVELPTYPFQHQRFWPEPVVGNGDPLRYEVAWLPVSPPSGGALSGTWAVVTSESAESADCVRELTSRGADVVEFAASAMSREAVAERLTDAAPSGVVALLGGPSDPAEALWELVVLGQGLVDSGVEAPLWIVTRGAVAVADGDAVSPAAAGLWGLGRVFGLEHGAAWGGMIDVAGDDAWSPMADVLAASEAAAPAATAPEAPTVPTAAENEVAVRQTGSYGRRLVPAEVTSPAAAPDLAGGTVLVTGGTGSLGSNVAGWLGERGVARLVLAGRSGRRGDTVDELEKALPSVEIEVVACDVGDPHAVRELLARLDDLRGVVHAAGVVEDLALRDLDRAAFDRVVRAKVLGGLNLHEAAPEVELFVTFSSISGVWGSSGQAVYAAGNAFLDGLVAHRRGLGLAGTSVAWGPWAGGGMAADEEIAKTLVSRGLKLMRPESAIAALARSVDHGISHSVVADVDWPRLVAMFDIVGLAGLFADVHSAEEPAGQPTGGLAEIPETERPDVVAALVREQAAAALGYAGPDTVEMDRPFRDLGFDSLTAVEFRDRLRTATGLPVGSTVIYDHPTPERLAQHILGLLAPAPAGRTATPVASTPVDEPVAIVGMACRLPGGIGSPDKLWSLLESGGEAIGPFPTDRGWDPALIGSGGFLYDAAGFDATFFGISPREALAMDPQQRLVLECSWEALERAGIDPAALRGTEAGVFLGLSHQDYGPRLHESSSEAEGYLLTGSAQGVASGRVAYVLGFEGPAVSVDTACSSSLVSLHLAAQALRRGECTLALAGGVMVMATPGAFAEFGRQGGLAADGRCKAFSDDADGTGWSEGAGIIAVERLSDAKRLGHPVLAVVRGSAINSDGASNGLTAPNGPSQQRVIQRALADAGLRAAEVDAVEAHGTGTKLGDPIEAQALLATYGHDHPADDPLWMGSLKSNIGHTQAAAGVAGVIKMVQAMRHGVLPKTLHADTPSSHVDWNGGNVELLTEPRSWPERDRPRRAAVSAFGLSGTNAHVILEQGPESQPEPEPVGDVVVPWVLSAKNTESLTAQAAGIAAVPGSPVDIGWSLATTRTSMTERAVVVGATHDELLAGLYPLTVRGQVLGAGRVGVVFSGQGSQCAGMGQLLRARFPVFAETFDEICGQFDAGVAEAMRTGESLDRTEFTQPALFAYEVAMYDLLESWGVDFEVLVGHSIGEIAAAYVAGVWSLEDACVLVAARGRLMGALPAGGAMVSLQATEEEVAPLLTEGVSIAAVNGPASVVVSGVEAEVETVVSALPDRKSRRLTVSHAFHSPLMKPMLAEFRQVAEGLTYHHPAMPVVSNVTGRQAGADLTDPEYWVRHVREPVRFADGVGTMIDHGVDAVVEIGPRPVLSSAIHEIGDVPVAQVARDGLSEDRAVLTGAGRLWVTGAHVDWSAIFEGLRPRRVELPTYPFARERFWLTAPTPASEEPSAADGPFWEAVHRLDSGHLGAELGLADTSGLATLLPALSDWRRRRETDALLDGLRYRTEWVAVDQPPATTAKDARWLVVVGDDQEASADGAPLPPDQRLRPAPGSALPTGVRTSWPLAGRIVDVLAGHGVRVETLTMRGDDGRVSLAKRLADIGGEFDGVLSLLALSGGHDAGPDVSLLTRTLAVFQALADVGATGPFWAVTRETVGIGGDCANPAAAPLWGFGRSAALEAPHRWGGLIDLPGEPAQFQLDRLGELLTSRHPEDQLVIRANTTFARRLARVQAPADMTTWEPRGTVLVSGGTGALGTQVAHWLADQGAEHILLLSRNGTEAGWVADLRERTEVTVAHCDVADEGRLREVLEEIPERLPLRTVIHAAGVLDDGVLDTMTPEQVERVVAPKAAGAWNLHRFTSGLDRFVMFSSVAATWGNAGQANYAAANAYLDALAAHRQAEGLPASTIAWGAWAEGGMAADPAVTRRMARAGMTALHPDQALKVLRQVLESGETTLTAVDIDWPRFVAHVTAARPSTLFTTLVTPAEQAAEQAADQQQQPPALPELAHMRPAERQRVLLRQVRATVAAVLAHGSADAVGPRQRFTDLGFDSLTAVELRNQLAAATGLDLPATLVFDFPTPADLADELNGRFAPEADTEPASGSEGAAGIEAASAAGRSEDEAVRGALNSIPLRKLREAGLYDVLLRIGGESGTETKPTLEDEFESMNAEDLIRLALGDEG